METVLFLTSSAFVNAMQLNERAKTYLYFGFRFREFTKVSRGFVDLGLRGKRLLMVLESAWTRLWSRSRRVNI